MNELVSVIIPAYNAEKTIENCIESILKQTHQNIEVIIIDDGSIDKTSEIVEKYVQTDPRVILLHKENGGQSSARNLGLERMSGNLFLYVDSDDEIMSEMIADLYAQIVKTNSDISMCGMLYRAGRKEVRKYCEIEGLILTREEIVRSFLLEKFAFGPMCKLFRTEKVGSIRFKEGIIFEDVEYLSRVYLTSNSVSCCSYPGYIYYVRNGSTIHSKFDEKKLDLLKVTDLIIKRIISENLFCDKEILLFTLNSYLSILLMAADSGKYRNYSDICEPLVAWLRENQDRIKENKFISKRQKVYTKIFISDNSFLIYLLASMRR